MKAPFPKLNLPEVAFHWSSNELGQTLIFDPIRKGYFVCTPEEWVRQHLIAYLTQHLDFPLGLTSVERGVKPMGQTRRYDILIYSRQASPLVLCECKAPHIEIAKKDIMQASLYNTEVKAPYLLLTNGMQLVFLELTEGNWSVMPNIPTFDELNKKGAGI